MKIHDSLARFLVHIELKNTIFPLNLPYIYIFCFPSLIRLFLLLQFSSFLNVFTASSSVLSLSALELMDIFFFHSLSFDIKYFECCKIINTKSEDSIHWEKENARADFVYNCLDLHVLAGTCSESQKEKKQ